jgi:sugar phosphate isomerase/epimerase
MADRSRLCVHTMTTKPWSLAEACAGYAEQGIRNITVWRQHLPAAGAAAARRLLDAHGLRATSLCRGGFFVAAEASARAAAVDDNVRAIDEAFTIGAPLIVLVCGAQPGIALSEARAQIADGIAAILPRAREAGVRLAIEPLHPAYAADRSAVNSIAQARRICARVNARGRTDVGVAADIYHLWWDDTLDQEIAELGASGLLHAVHICDWKAEQEHPLEDRGLMGEGVCDVRGFVTSCERAGFSGPIEVEIFSRRHWARDQREWLRDVVAAYETCC